MAGRAGKHCGKPLGAGTFCRTLVPGGSKGGCEVHKPKPYASNRTPCGKETASKQWRDDRVQTLARDGHQCRIRHPDKCLGVATQVDHITPRAAFATRQAADVPSNRLSVSEPCHHWKTVHTTRTADHFASAMCRG